LSFKLVVFTFIIKTLSKSTLEKEAAGAANCNLKFNLRILLLQFAAPATSS